MCSRSISVPAELGTQMSPNAAAAGNGPRPTGTTSMMWFVAGSIRETVFEPLFGTKTVPSSAMAALSGALPTRIVATTRSRRGLIRETVFDLAFDTQTALFETATDRGAFPTKMLRSLLVRGLIL
jgi:hypothetical protein